MEFGIVELSRLQFPMTTRYHFLFVPLTLCLSIIVALMETVYVLTKVQVCGIYLPGKGTDASVLLEVVTGAAPDATGAAIVAPGSRLLTF